MLIGGASFASVVRPEASLADEAAKPYPQYGLQDQFKLSDYEDMRDDKERTLKYELAIKRRLEMTSQKLTVLDLGTGAFALLAIQAARAGAKKVYAVEREAWAAQAARQAVADAGLEDTIVVIEGDSTSVKLPEKVDLIVSEIIGNTATGEGVVDIIRDARKRFLKECESKIICDARKRFSGAKMIPARCKTLVAPISYRYHKLKGSQREFRLDSMTKDLLFLSKPQVLENFEFEEPQKIKGVKASDLTENAKLLFPVPAQIAEQGGEFSGFAFWNRIELDEDNVIEVKGKPSHWPFVVLLTEEQPKPIPVGAQIELISDVDVSAGKFGSYKFKGELVA